nr:Rha family transcriptional regulator [Clostridium neonatale]
MTNKLENRISSREVAEMMEMQHKDLLKKIDGINKDFGGEKVRYEKYWVESTFINRGKEYREFLISKKGCEFLAHKTIGTKGNLFTDKYMDRFTAMEEYIREGIQSGTTAKPILELQCLDVTSKLLRFNDNSKLLGVRRIYNKYDLETSFLPDYTQSKGILRSATELLNINNINMSAIKFNKILVDKGILEEKTRSSSKDKSKVKKFKSLINLEYGENQVNPKSPKETQPLFYEDKFMELLKEVGIVED